MINSQVVLVTGGTGFLGEVLINLLILKGFNVVLLVRKTSLINYKEKIFKNKKIELIYTDSIDDIKNKKIDFIIHLATCYGRNNETKEEIEKVNINLPKELIKLTKNSKVIAFINADTFFTTKLVLEGKLNTYVETKKRFLNEVNAFFKDSKTKFVNMKIEHMYGPGDSINKFIPYVIDHLLYNKNISLTPGEQKRDFVYVEDVAEAFLTVLKNHSSLDQNSEFDIGIGKSYSLKKFLILLKEISNSSSELLFGELPYRKNEIMDSFANLEKNRNLNWTAQTTLEQGIKKMLLSYE